MRKDVFSQVVLVASNVVATVDRGESWTYVAVIPREAVSVIDTY